ncbi:MAG: response regulator [Deltaproteobacteria bacterium]|nr:MAG: response regulator [Deltaproteobacteria bacterium]
MIKGKKIFVVEDDREFCELYQMTLGTEGYQTSFAHTGREALEKIPAERPDLVIMDVMMPEIDGYEVCRRLRALPAFVLTPIIILTALSTDEAKIKGYDVGADDYITKPVSIKVLTARVRSILERSSARMSQPTPAGEAGETIAGQAAADSTTINPGERYFEELLGAPIPSGSNILIIGPLGSGKSSFAHSFVAQGLRNGDKSLFVCLDSDPALVREELSLMHHLDVRAYEDKEQLRFVDAYSWSGRGGISSERFAITEALELSDLSLLITQAAVELGQTERQKLGGRRVIDSLSSLFLNFELPHVQRFIAFLVRSGHFAGASTTFLLDQGVCDERALNNIREMMDAVVEFRTEKDEYLGRVQTTKWAAAASEWTNITRA